MEFEDSSLMQEVAAVQNSETRPQFTWSCQLFTGDKTMTPLKVLSIDEDWDFENMFAPELMIKIAMPGGMYAYDVYPGQADLEIEVTRRPLKEVGDNPDEDIPERTIRYRAILVDRGNPVMEGNNANVPTRVVLDLTKIEEVEFQLISKIVEKLRVVSIGGVYRGNTVEEVIKGILTTESAKIKIDNDTDIKGVEMLPASNTKARDHIVIPHGLPLVLLPEYIQKRCGVYSAGMGYFLLNNYWYVYPCYDTERYAETTETFTVINVPRNKFRQVERTWRKDGDNLVIIASGDVKFRDGSNKTQLNMGNGVRFMDANVAFGDAVKVEGNKAIAARAVNNSEFISEEREDGLKLARLSDNPITANPYEEFSKMARRAGSVFAFTWENADLSLIKPGMMGKIMYLEEDEIKEVYGVILKASTFHHMTEPGYTATRYRSNTALSIYIKMPKDK